MNSLLKICLALCLSLAFGWAGKVLAEHRSASSAMSIPAAPADFKGSGAGAANGGQNVADPQLAARRAVAGCESEALWKWLESPGSSGMPEMDLPQAVVEELFAREGIAAVRRAFTLTDRNDRAKFSELFLDALSSKDPAAAYAIYKSHQKEFNGTWANECVRAAIQAACTRSAEDLIAIVYETQGSYSTCVSAGYAADFKFEEVLDRIGTYSPSTAPRDLLARWAERSPAQAATWIIEHPDADVLRKNHTGDPGLSEIFNSIAHLPGPEKSQGLSTLMKMPEKVLADSWKEIANEGRGKLDRELLDAARTMDRLSFYLVESLLKTRTMDELDSSWSVVPKEDRQVALKAALDQWSEEDPSPTAEKARTHWRQIVETRWRQSDP
ncbi:MAG: hypothetical protein JWO82_3405 [Akkermansiaceae bacterium]|nr:hypothetical protein [Akkermansiaceae bacterium]